MDVVILNKFIHSVSNSYNRSLVSYPKIPSPFIGIKGSQELHQLLG